eukprot:654627-Hanusia_phi.AAC.1
MRMGRSKRTEVAGERSRGGTWREQKDRGSRREKSRRNMEGAKEARTCSSLETGGMAYGQRRSRRGEGVNKGKGGRGGGGEGGGGAKWKERGREKGEHG